MRLKELFEGVEEDDNTVVIDELDVENGKLTRKYNRVFGSFTANSVGLWTLENGPTYVEEDFTIRGGQLKSLEYGPTEVGGSYECSGQNLQSLDYAPQNIGGNFYCNKNQIKSLQGIGRKFLKSMDGYICIYNNPLKSHIAGVMLIEGLTKFKLWSTFGPTQGNTPRLEEIHNIVNACLDNGDDITDLQEALIDAGLREYAKI